MEPDFTPQVSWPALESWGAAPSALSSASGLLVVTAVLLLGLMGQVGGMRG